MAAAAISSGRIKRPLGALLLGTRSGQSGGSPSAIFTWYSLGVSTQPVRLPANLSQQLNQETGLLLVAVEPGSPADQAGLLLGDTIVNCAGAPVRQHDDLLAALGGDRIGSQVPVRIIRGGQLQDINVTVGERN